MSGVRSAAAKKPFSCATALGQKFADDEPTEISVTVSAAIAGRAIDAETTRDVAARIVATDIRRFIGAPIVSVRSVGELYDIRHHQRCGVEIRRQVAELLHGRYDCLDLGARDDAVLLEEF